MQPEEHEGSDATLSKTLGAWEVSAPLPPRFNQRVWQRIAREEAERPAGAWSRAWAWVNQLGAARLRPALAVSYAAVLVAGGLLAGYWQARVENARTAQDLGSRYVRMVAAYEMPPR
jgi:hypothetical protein